MIFSLQKRTVRIIAGVKSRNSRRKLFISLEFLPLPCEYIFILMNFVVNNQEHFQTQQYTVLTLRIETICIDQLPTFHVSKQCILCWHQTFQLSTSKSDKAYD